MGAPSQQGVPAAKTGTRMDGWMDRRADEFHKSKRAVPNTGVSLQTWGNSDGSGKGGQGGQEMKNQSSVRVSMLGYQLDRSQRWVLVGRGK